MSDVAEFDELVASLADAPASGSDHDDYGPPPPVSWMRLDDVPGPIIGAAVCIMTEDGPRYGLRAVSELHPDLSGSASLVKLLREEDWWRWALDPQRSEEPPHEWIQPTRHIWARIN